MFIVFLKSLCLHGVSYYNNQETMTFSTISVKLLSWWSILPPRAWDRGCHSRVHSTASEEYHTQGICHRTLNTGANTVKNQYNVYFITRVKIGCDIRPSVTFFPPWELILSLHAGFTQDGVLGRVGTNTWPYFNSRSQTPFWCSCRINRLCCTCYPKRDKITR